MLVFSVTVDAPQVTLTANDGSPELAAACRRGPFAIPDDNELLDYLLSRRRSGRASAEQHSVFHVISYQRRLSMVKNDFFARGCVTPLGITADWWDRTEAQQRGALHSHILGDRFCCRALVRIPLWVMGDLVKTLTKKHQSGTKSAWPKRAIERCRDLSAQWRGMTAASAREKKKHRCWKGLFRKTTCITRARPRGSCMCLLSARAMSKAARIHSPTTGGESLVRMHPAACATYAGKALLGRLRLLHLTPRRTDALNPKSKLPAQLYSPLLP